MKKRFYKITWMDLGSFCIVPVVDWEAIRQEIECDFPSNAISIAPVEMTQEEFDALPEFTGP